LLAFVGVVPIVLFGLLAWDGRQKALDQAAEHTRTTVAMLHEHALKVFETHELILRQADSWGEGRDWDTIERDERLQRALRAAVDGSGQVKSIWMIDASGRARVGTELVAQPLDLSDRDYFRAQRDRDADTYISDVFVGRVLTTPAFGASRRRSTASGEFDGVIEVSVDPSYFIDFWKGLGSELDPAVALTRSDGAILARYPALHAGNGPRLAPIASLIEAFGRADAATGSWRSAMDGSERILSYNKLGPYPVYVTFSVGREAVLAQWREDVIRDGVFALAALAALGAIALLAWRQARAAAAAEAIATTTQLRLRNILESTTDCVYLIDREWRFSYVNERANAVLAQGRELLGRNGWKLFPDLVGGPFWNNYRRAMFERVPVDFETFYAPLGAWFEVHACPASDGIAVFFRDISERKRADDALRRSQEHLARAQRAAAIGSWGWLACSGAVTWSEETYRLFGASPESFVPTRETIIELVHPEDRAATRRIGDMVTQGLTPTPEEIACDHRVVLPNGSVRVLHREGGSMLDADGRPIGLIGTVQDVTASREAERRLRNSEARYRLAAHAAGCVIWEWNAETDGVEYAGPLQELFGYAPSEIDSGQRWWQERIHPEDRAAVLRSLERASRERAALWDAEYRMRRADGTYASVHDRALTTYDVAGEPVLMVGAMIDISARKEMERELRRSEAHLARAQQVASIGSFEYDPRSGALRWSDETYRIFGLDREAFAPTIETVEARIHPDDRGVTRTPAHDLARGRRPPLSALSCDYRMIRPDGELRQLHRECDLVFDASGEIISVVGTVQDVTEQRAAEAKRLELEMQLLHAQKLESLGTLAGGIAHDLNNTLTPIVALSKLVQASLPDGAREHRNLEIIRNAGIRARDLVKQILAFSRRESPKKELVDLAGLIDESLAMLRASIPATIRIDVSAEDVPPVVADPSHLQQVLVNLVMNAAQAIGGGMGTIEVGLSCGGAEFVCLSVSDTGCGMKEEIRLRIFDPFFTTKPAGEGTGLGLAVVHGIVSSHGGRIEVASAPGSGARFEVHLPTAPADPGRATAPAQSHAAD
jgi:PAS domain S-box-containing protein